MSLVLPNHRCVSRQATTLIPKKAAIQRAEEHSYLAGWRLLLNSGAELSVKLSPRQL